MPFAHARSRGGSRMREACESCSTIVDMGLADLAVALRQRAFVVVLFFLPLSFFFLLANNHNNPVSAFLIRSVCETHMLTVRVAPCSRVLFCQGKFMRLPNDPHARKPLLTCLPQFLQSSFFPALPTVCAAVTVAVRVLTSTVSAAVETPIAPVADAPAAPVAAGGGGEDPRDNRPPRRPRKLCGPRAVRC